jgi:hypothetical protein
MIIEFAASIVWESSYPLRSRCARPLDQYFEVTSFGCLLDV